MMSKRIFNITRPREGADGKTYWDRHGILVVDGDKISIKLESVPVGEWNGWFNCFAPADETNRQPQRHAQQAPGGFDFDDDIPF